MPLRTVARCCWWKRRSSWTRSGVGAIVRGVVRGVVVVRRVRLVAARRSGAAIVLIGRPGPLGRIAGSTPREVLALTVRRRGVGLGPSGGVAWLGRVGGEQRRRWRGGVVVGLAGARVASATRIV